MKIVYLGAEVGFEALKKELNGRANAGHVEASSEALEEALQDADALLDASMKTHITNRMIQKAKKLKIIACATTGSDHIDREELESRSIPVRTLREDPELLRNITPAAELSWALLMACARRLPAAVAHVRAGGWVRESFPGIMLRGKQIGIIGCGRLGSWMGRYAFAFGMKVVGYDPYVVNLPENFTSVSLEEIMETSDFITIHVHLSEETRGLVTRRHFEMVKPGAVFINTSRGGVIDETALLEALDNGRLGAAGLDVLDGEPAIDHHPLLQYAKTHDNLLITPHCAGFSPDAVALVCAHSAKKIIQALGLEI